ncbi:fasciclin domain-containing protein [Actinomycetota bacterium]
MGHPNGPRHRRSDVPQRKGRTSNAKIIAANISASNGVVHAIDNVLVPQDYRTAGFGATFTRRAIVWYTRSTPPVRSRVHGCG